MKKYRVIFLIIVLLGSLIMLTGCVKTENELQQEVENVSENVREESNQAIVQENPQQQETVVETLKLDTNVIFETNKMETVSGETFKYTTEIILKEDGKIEKTDMVIPVPEGPGRRRQ